MSIHIDLDVAQHWPYLIPPAVILYLLFGLLFTKIMLGIDKAWGLRWYVNPDGSEVMTHIPLTLVLFTWPLWVPICFLMLVVVCLSQFSEVILVKLLATWRKD